MTEAGFVPFLLQDNSDLSSSSTQQVLEAINQDLSQLLRLPPALFWRVVVSDDSLHVCLDSFLRFRRRCYDDAPDAEQGSSDLLLQLSQRVFKVFWRMTHIQEEQQRGPAAAGTPKQQQQPPPLQQQQVAELLYDKWLMDVPKMMDLAVLYGPGSSTLTQQLLHQLLQLQPKYAQDIFDLCTPLTANLHELLESVKRLGGQLLNPKAAAAAAREAASQRLLSELAEAAGFILDAALTLQAFVACLPEAAALLLHPRHHGELLIVVAALYSSTLPLLRRVAQQPGAAAAAGAGAAGGLSPPRLQRLQQALESLVAALLRGGFCTRAGALAGQGPGAVAAQAAAAAAVVASPSRSASSSSSSSRWPPAGPSSAAAAAPLEVDAETQGQELMNLLMLLAHPGDAAQLALQQQQQAGLGGAQQQGNLLAAVNHVHHLDVAVSAAVAEGLLALDDAQFDYFLALVDGDRELLQQHQAAQQQAWSRQQHAAAPSSSSSSSATAAAAGSSGAPVLPADLPAKVAAIQELLPEYGAGFLTAALFHHGWDSEAAINSLLEGALPPTLKDLDRRLPSWTPPAAPSSSSGSGAAAANGGGGGGLSWTGLAREAASAGPAPPAAAKHNVPLPSLAAAAAAAPRAGVDRRTGRVLGALPGRLRDYTKSVAQEMQYEDEYDDSYDDLMGPNDGVCDIEGEDGGAGSRTQRGPAATAAGGGGADEYADEPAGRPPHHHQQQQQQQQQHQQLRGRPPQQRKERLWVLDGKVYNYKKEGAQEVGGQAGAQAALRAAAQAAQEIHGLGPGGNVPLAVQPQQRQQQQPQQQQQQQQGQSGGAAGGPRPQPQQAGPGPGPGGRGGGGGRGRGGGGGGGGAGQDAAGQEDGGGGGRGRGRGSYGHKEAHKSAIANHHRKDRAAQKQSRGMF